MTGAAGFIGTNFVRYWLDAHPGDDVVALDALTYAGVRENVDGLPGVRFVNADIGDTEVVAAELEKHAYQVPEKVVPYFTPSPSRTGRFRSTRQPRTGGSGSTCWITVGPST